MANGKMRHQAPLETNIEASATKRKAVYPQDFPSTIRTAGKPKDSVTGAVNHSTHPPIALWHQEDILKGCNYVFCKTKMALWKTLSMAFV